MQEYDHRQAGGAAAVDFGISAARSQIGKGESETHCLDCGRQIPEGRRQIVKGCMYCVKCQEKHDKVLTISQWRQ
ncbi:TraR/DksA C4-type zinc finger protein [Herbiconiux daphne]|uniref:TraR/DksA C4-type zinc finger protein n=1 Tax=Herbiconiux daphne TaxID=2970914 RepID=UPI0038B2D1AD